jgi:hypothetical protein
MPETFPTAAATASTVAEAVDFFVSEALARAQVALYRGFIHEVNNAVGGVGTLAEAMKGSPSETIEVHLDLISSTMGKIAELEKRIRAMQSAPLSPVAFRVDLFVEPYRDLLELMLPRSVKVSWELEAVEVTKSPQRVLQLLMAAFALAREASQTFVVRLGREWAFDFGQTPASTDSAGAARMMRALEALGISAGFSFTKTPTGILLANET